MVWCERARRSRSLPCAVADHSLDNAAMTTCEGCVVYPEVLRVQRVAIFAGGYVALLFLRYSQALIEHDLKARGFSLRMRSVVCIAQQCHDAGHCPQINHFSTTMAAMIFGGSVQY